MHPDPTSPLLDAEVYAFRDRMIAQWRLDCVNIECPPVGAPDPSLPPKARAAARKTLDLAQAIRKLGLRGLLFGIRRDQQPVRGEERVFSPRTPGGT